MDVRRGVQDPFKGAHQLRNNDIGTGGSGVRERANGLRGNTADNCRQQRTNKNKFKGEALDETRSPKFNLIGMCDSETPLNFMYSFHFIHSPAGIADLTRARANMV